eukprot:2259434-Pyramimonas_sp.AAC.1
MDNDTWGELEDLAGLQEASREKVYAEVPGVTMGPRNIATLSVDRSAGDDADCSWGAEVIAAHWRSKVQSSTHANLSCFFAPAGPAEMTAVYASDTEEEVPRGPCTLGPNRKLQAVEHDMEDLFTSNVKLYVDRHEP